MMDREPVAIISAIASLARAVVSVLLAFGVTMTADQQDSAVDLVQSVVAALVAWGIVSDAAQASITRSYVWCRESVRYGESPKGE